MGLGEIIQEYAKFEEKKIKDPEPQGIPSCQRKTDCMSLGGRERYSKNLRENSEDLECQLERKLMKSV